MTGVWYDKDRKKWRVRFRGKYVCRCNTEDEAIAIRTELNKQICRATPRQLEIYRLCSPDFEGLKQKEAAAILGIAKSGIHKALKTLRNKCPELPPTRVSRKSLQRFEDWMSDSVTVKF